MKVLIKIAGVLLILVVIGVVVLVLNLDKGIKAAVENLGPRLTQSDVTLNKVSLSPRTGEGSLQGLVVGNPAGFKTPNAFSLGEIAVALDTDTLAGDPIVINSIRILAPEITYETGKTLNNLQQIQKNIEQAMGGRSGTSSPDQETEGAAKKLIIRDLLVASGKIHYSNPLLSSNMVELKLPDIHMSGIGEKSGGATAIEVVDQIISVINSQASTVVLNSDAVKELGRQVTDRIDQEKGKLDQQKADLEQKKENLEGTVEGLKKIFDK